MDLMMPSTKSETKPKLSWSFEALGTRWEIVSDKVIQPSLQERIEDYIEQFDATYSRFRTDSLVYQMSQYNGEYVLPEGSDEMFDFYDSLYELSNKKVTPLVGDTLSSAGYDKDYSLRPDDEIVKVPDYKNIHRVGLDITLSMPTMIDIGAVGKGYLVDKIVELMRKNGHDSFVVDASGDIYCAGDRAEVVGLENPHDTKEIIGSVELTDKALCASAVNRRAWGDWHHVIDPSTSRPTNEVVATWVIADSTMIADGLATALFFTAPKKLAATYNYEYLRMHANGSVEYSEYFAKGVF